MGPAGVGPYSDSASTQGSALDLAALGLDAHDRAVLVSMTRMLDGQAGLRLRWVEDLNACTTLFVPHDWSQYVSPPRVLVRLTPRGEPAGVALYQLARGAVKREPARVALYAWRDVLVGALLAGERRRTLFGLGDGHGIVVDFRTATVESSLSQAELLVRPLQLADPQRAPAVVSWPGATHTFALSSLLWAMTHALVDQGVSPRTINGRYQLVRPPEPEALARPKMPALVTAWTQRAMSVGEAAAAGRLSAFEILWFLSTALALGIAVPAEAAQADTTQG